MTRDLAWLSHLAVAKLEDRRPSQSDWLAHVCGSQQPKRADHSPRRDLKTHSPRRDLRKSRASEPYAPLLVRIPWRSVCSG